MNAVDITVISTIIPTAVATLATLYRIGNVMGRIEEKLETHDARIGNLETRVYHPRPSYGPATQE